MSPSRDALDRDVDVKIAVALDRNVDSAVAVVAVVAVPSPTLADQWAALASAALLGTDRRPAPVPLPGPLADLVGASRPADDAESVLVQVAALAAARRAGLRPASAALPLASCPDDDRPLCPPAAARRLDELIGAWPELVDEWLTRLAAAGFRLRPQHVVALAIRHRTDAPRRILIDEAAGPLAPWLAGLFPAQLGSAARSRTRPVAPSNTAASSTAASNTAVSNTAAVDEPFPLPPDLAPLVGAAPSIVIGTLVDGLSRGRFANRHRAVLVHLVRRLDPPVLAPLAEALSRAGTNASTLGLTMSLADLARRRAAMIAELTPPATTVTTAATEATEQNGTTDEPDACT